MYDTYTIFFYIGYTPTLTTGGRRTYDMILICIRRRCLLRIIGEICDSGDEYVGKYVTRNVYCYGFVQDRTKKIIVNLFIYAYTRWSNVIITVQANLDHAFSVNALFNTVFSVFRF